MSEVKQTGILHFSVYNDNEGRYSYSVWLEGGRTIAITRELLAAHDAYQMLAFGDGTYQIGDYLLSPVYPLTEWGGNALLFYADKIPQE